MRGDANGMTHASSCNSDMCARFLARRCTKKHNPATRASRGWSSS